MLGILGPNGAGKITAVRIVLAPDGGTARINGFDVVRDAERVRRNVGLTGRYASVDEDLTGRPDLTGLRAYLDRI